VSFSTMLDKENRFMYLGYVIAKIELHSCRQIMRL